MGLVMPGLAEGGRDEGEGGVQEDEVGSVPVAYRAAGLTPVWLGQGVLSFSGGLGPLGVEAGGERVVRRGEEVEGEALPRMPCTSLFLL